jgi:hypothetical protein
MFFSVELRRGRMLYSGRARAGTNGRRAEERVPNLDTSVVTFAGWTD